MIQKDYASAWDDIFIATNKSKNERENLLPLDWFFGIIFNFTLSVNYYYYYYYFFHCDTTKPMATFVASNVRLAIALADAAPSAKT